MRKKIGIVAWSTGENSFGCQKPYLYHLSDFGDVIMLTPMMGIIEDLDLVVLPGGQDTYSGNYNQPPGYYNTHPDQFKEWFVDNNLDQYIEAGVPIWGTCLGFQQLIVHFGGELTQHIGGHKYSTESRNQLVHELIFTPKFKGLEHHLTKGKKPIETCSLHHQGAYEDQIPECFDIIAGTKDGIVEVIQHKTLAIAGGQFHVEEDYNILATHLIEKLINTPKEANVKNHQSNQTESV